MMTSKNILVLPEKHRSYSLCNAAIKTDDDHTAKYHKSKYSREEAKPH